MKQAKKKDYTKFLCIAGILALAGKLYINHVVKKNEKSIEPESEIFTGGDLEEL